MLRLSSVERNEDDWEMEERTGRVSVANRSQKIIILQWCRE